jgi:hypothetical protein
VGRKDHAGARQGLRKFGGAARNAIEPAIRRCFHLYWRMSRGLTLGVRGLVRDEAGRVSLTERAGAL